jgi:DNA-directed RNA polymerase II subunit RPB2
LTQHHIRSYEAFVFREMMDIIQAENPITILKEPIEGQPGLYKYKSEIFIGGLATNPADLNIEVGPPVITLDKGQTVRRMFPNEARIRDLTYAASYVCEILIRTTFTYPDTAAPGKFKNEVSELRVPKFKLFSLPILLRSKLCATHGADKDLLWEMGECRNDQGGYFIIDGSEKLLITRQEQAYNSLYCAVKPPSDKDIATYASVICQHPVTKQSRRVAFYRLHEKEGIQEGVIRVSVPYVKGAIPLFVLFRALGVESDKEIVRMILPDENAGLTKAMETTLLPCIQDAWPLTNQTQAIEFIKTLTKGFVIADVLNILRTHLFSHVPDRPLARAQYLAEIIRKMIRIEMRLEPNVNRDDIRNQRLLPTGTLLRGLFSDCWKEWKKAVRLEVDKLYNYNKPLYQDKAFLNLFSTGNLNTVLTTKVLNDGIMRGFRGKWGTNQYNMKTGVIQPVARISYLDAMSHTRRVVSDFDTSMKLTGPRQLHPSQVGYFCTSETPTGAHIGATKNLSILTAVSVAVPTTAFMNWLFTRGGVIEVSDASTALRAVATSVQINGGTIGFTLKPLLLTRVLKYMKWTACLPPTASISFNTSDNILRIYLDDGRPLRPLYHLASGGKWPAVMNSVRDGVEPPPWRTMVCGTLPLNATRGIESADFVDPFSERGTDDLPTLEDYEAELAPHIGCVEYVDPYEGNESYISWWGREDNLTPEHTHTEIHPSSLMGLLANMIPFANHNQSPRNQLSCSQSKQGIGYYATNYESRFDTYGSMLCYGEGALCRTIVHDAVAGGAMPYGTNLIFALLCFNGYNQDDGILFNRSSIERGMFRSLALRSYATVEEEDPISKAIYRIGNPRSVLAWTDLKPGLDYTGLDDNGIIKEGTVIHDKTVLVARYITNKETNKISDASLLPTVFTRGRVDKVVVLHQANGMRLVRVRILEERVPELGDKFCLTPDHDVLTASRGWVPISDVSNEDSVYTLDPKTNSIVLANPSTTYKFECVNENLYNIESQQVDLMTTLNHKMWIQKRNKDNYELCEAKEIIGHRVRYMKNALNTNNDYIFKIPSDGVKDEQTINMDAWLEFLGLWISDGWVTEAKPRRGRTSGELRIEISAVIQEHRKQLYSVCEKLGFNTISNKNETKYFIYNHQVAKYLKTLSVGAVNKQLPSWVFDLSQRQARVLLNGLLNGDGHITKKGIMTFFTSSSQLRDDVQRLCLHCGYSANISLRNKAGTTFNIRGKTVKTNADSWVVHIVRTKNNPTVNHGHVKTQKRQRESLFNYTGNVYCIEVPNHIFYVRRNGKPVWTGNSSRHGQKGTMGMLLDAVDMPRTADGMVPDVVVNPHCIPSRMTIAQLLEQVFGKFGAAVGAKMNATSFMNDGDSFTAIADALQKVGMQREGEEILYSGITGQMYTSSVFMAPLYFMRLKHLTQDKQNSRAAGRKEIRTHQPTGGRGNEGGMRIGEMERDSLIAHGVTGFLQESMMKRSDGSSFVVCNGCGTIPIYNAGINLYVCPLCDGPLKYQGTTEETIGLVLPVRKSRTTFSRVEVPYALKLLDQELTTYMNGGLRFLTEAGARRFREPTDMDLETLFEVEEAEVAASAVQTAAPATTAVAVDDGGPAADEDAPADRDDEGEPARNLLASPPAIPAGTEVIKFYSKIPEYREFSSYYPVDLMIDGLRYRSTEHYFQAMKFPEHPEYQEMIRKVKKPREAKKLGKTEDYAIRPDWATHRDTVMMTALREKFSDRHPELKNLLLDTGNAILQEASPRDNYWGTGSKGMGQNKLGVMLMALRDELRGGLPVSSGGGLAPSAAFDTALMDKTQVLPAAPVEQAPQGSPVVVINAAPTLASPTGVAAMQNTPQANVGNVEAPNNGPPILTINTEPVVAAPQSGGGGVGLNPGSYPVVNAFNPAPPPSNAVILGAQANTPPCNQVPSTGATAYPSVAPLPNVPLVQQVPQPEPEYKVLTLSSDPNTAGKK